MNLDEAIQHAEEVAKECKLHYDQFPEQLAYTEKFYDAVKCSEEHRQLGEWLKELKRARTLLKATHELLMKQNDSGYVLNLLGETIFYDEAECDGCCLMNDIEYLLEYGVYGGNMEHGI